MIDAQVQAITSDNQIASISFIICFALKYFPTLHFDCLIFIHLMF